MNGIFVQLFPGLLKKNSGAPSVASGDITFFLQTFKGRFYSNRRHTELTAECFELRQAVPVFIILKMKTDDKVFIYQIGKSLVIFHINHVLSPDFNITAIKIPDYIAV